MGTVNRATKSTGGTDYSDGGPILSAEVNLDLNTLYTELAAGLDDVNIRVGAGTTRINPLKIDDFSTNNTESNLVASPGSTAVPLRALDLSAELKRLRYMIRERGIGTSVEYNTTSAIAEIGPNEPAIVGPNLLRNGGLQGYTIGSAAPPTSPPNNWTWSSVPTEAVLETTPTSEGSLYALKIESAAINDTLQQVVTGIKADTQYLIGCRGYVDAGDAATIGATGGKASNTSYGDGVTAIAEGTPFESRAIVIQSSNVGGDMTVKLTITNANDIVHVHSIFMYELAIEKTTSSLLPINHVNLAASTTYTDTGVAEWVEITEFTLSLRCPAPGYRIRYEAVISIFREPAAFDAGVMRLLENGSTVAGPWSIKDSISYPDVLSLMYVNDDPTPETNYEYKLEIRHHGSLNEIYNFSGLTVSGFQTESDVWLECRRVE